MPEVLSHTLLNAHKLPLFFLVFLLHMSGSKWTKKFTLWTR
jgi:hypothetical protein